MIEIIKNQPVSFHIGKDDFNTFNKDCTQDNIDFCQSVRPGDTTMFQMIQGPQTGVNLITNGDFSDGLSDWINLSGAWKVDTISGIPVSVSTVDPEALQQIVTGLSVDTTYRIKYDIVAVSPDAYLEIEVFNATASNYGTMATPPGETGTFTAFTRFTAGTGFTLLLIARMPGPQGAIQIDNIEILELSEPTITVEDVNSVVVLTVTDLAYYDDLIQATFEWPDVTEGKYNICISGVDDLSQNYLDDSLCIGLENGGRIFQENGQCLKWFG